MFVLKLRDERLQVVLLVVDDDADDDDDGRHGHARARAHERLGQAEEGADDEEDDVDEGDCRRQQLHHDGSGVRAVQPLDVEVLLLCCLVLHSSQLVLQTLEVFSDVQEPLLALVLDLLLHVGDARLDADDLVLVQLCQVADLIFQPVAVIALVPELVSQPLQFLQQDFFVSNNNAFKTIPFSSFSKKLVSGDYIWIVVN